MVQLQWGDCRVPFKNTGDEHTGNDAKTSQNVSQRRAYVTFRPVLECQNGTKRNTMPSVTYCRPHTTKKQNDFRTNEPEPIYSETPPAQQLRWTNVYALQAVPEP